MGAHQMMLSVEYGCKFTVWKTFYEVRHSASQIEQPKSMQMSAPQNEELKNGNTPQEVKSEKMTEVNIVPHPLADHGVSK